MDSTLQPRSRKPRAPYNLSQHWTYNDYRVEGDAAYLTLRNRQGQPTGEAIIDVADLARVREETVWSIFRPGGGTLCYVSGAQRKPMMPRGMRRPNILLHRFIVDAPTGSEVDHRNGNGLDNRRANLRVTDKQGNQRNARGHRRVRELETVLRQLLDCPHGKAECACKRAATLAMERAA